jgi:hypothetical protein
LRGPRTEETQAKLRLVELGIRVVEDGRDARCDAIEYRVHDAVDEEEEHDIDVQEQ